MGRQSASPSHIDKAGVRTRELAAVLNPSIDEMLDKGLALPALAA
jgi:hypothetical protein